MAVGKLVPMVASISPSSMSWLRDLPLSLISMSALHTIGNTVGFPWAPALFFQLTLAVLYTEAFLADIR